jgi:signal peptidase
MTSHGGMAVRGTQRATLTQLLNEGLVALGIALGSGALALLVVLGMFAIAVPAVSGSQSYTILTSSMKPNLPPGTFIVVERESPADLRLGDVITYQLVSGKPDVVTHRIVKVIVDSRGARTFLTQGDNNAVADGAAVRPVQIKGKLWYAIPYLGRIAGLRNTSEGMTVITLAGWASLTYGACLIALTIVGRVRRARES